MKKEHVNLGHDVEVCSMCLTKGKETNVAEV